MNPKQTLIKKLIEDETSIVESSQTWLENQYPAQPKDRLKTSNRLNYGNLQPFDGLTEAVKDYMQRYPKKKIVILAVITKTKRLCKKHILALREPDSYYYKSYELFACAYHLSGFVELFHNFEA